MASERFQRRIDRLLDQVEEAVDQLDWGGVRSRAQAVLALDPGNDDAINFLASAERALSGSTSQPTASTLATPLAATPEHRTSFANGRYQVKDFLGEGGKKKVFLAHDTLLDREVAFALIKTGDWTTPYAPASSERPRPWAASAPIPTSSPFRLG